MQWLANGGDILGSSTDVTCVVNWGDSGSGSLTISLLYQDGFSITKQICIEKIKKPNTMFFVPPYTVEDTELTICANQEVYFQNQSTANGGSDIYFYH